MSEALKKAIAYNIRMFTETSDLSMIEIANAAKMHPGQITHLKRGRSIPNLKTLHRLAKAIPGCSLADLVQE